MNERQIKADAEEAVERLSPLSGIDFGYNPESVQWLERYIERLRKSEEFLDPHKNLKLASMFGAFLGECVIHCYGGRWCCEDGQWYVVFDEGNAVYPFAKVSKQMNAGLDEGINGFFRMIPMLFAFSSDPLHRG